MADKGFNVRLSVRNHKNRSLFLYVHISRTVFYDREAVITTQRKVSDIFSIEWNENLFSYSCQMKSYFHDLCSVNYLPIYCSDIGIVLVLSNLKKKYSQF